MNRLVYKLIVLGLDTTKGLTNTVKQTYTPQTSGQFCYQAGTQNSCFRNTPQEPMILNRLCPLGSGRPEEKEDTM